MTRLSLAPNADPIQVFQTWMEEVRAAGQAMPETMNLATLGADGFPDSRMVLLKGVSAAGFVFYTNYQSTKAAQIKADPRGALAFWWVSLRRQVRVVGSLSKVSEALSDAYFQSRPRDSRIGAWASPQSQEIEDRRVLEERFQHYHETFGDGPIDRPAHWGGYCLKPHRIEFWQEGDHRLHDRFQFTTTAEGEWQCLRLAP